MKSFLVEKWDWFIYRLAQGTIKRMCERNPAYAYLFELWIQGWREEHPIDESLKSATEHFYKSLKT